MFNNCAISGYLTKDPEIKYTQSDEPVAIANYRIGCSRDYRTDGENVTDFINIKAFGKTAEWAEKYLKKGSLVTVTGRMTVDTWTNDSGNNVSFAYIKADRQYFGDKKDNSKNNDDGDAESADVEYSDDEQEDFPDPF